MRFSTLTMVAFVAHTSTQAIAAPLPLYDEVQDLVARADSANWASVATKLAQKVPAPLLEIHTGEEPLHVVQTLVQAAARAGPYRTGDGAPHISPMPAPEPNPILKSWNEKTGNLFTHPSPGTQPWGGVHRRPPKLSKRDPEIEELDWVN
jgi:hypothetical protein